MEIDNERSTLDDIDGSQPPRSSEQDPSDMVATGRRAALLHETFQKVLEYGLQDVSEKEFSSCYPNLSPELVKAMYETFQEQLSIVMSHSRKEFKDICSEHLVEEQLEALNRADTTLHTQAAPGQPGTDAVVQRAEDAVRLEVLKHEAMYLQDLLERAREQETRFAEALAKRKEHIAKMANTLADVVSDATQVYDITRVWPRPPQLGSPSV